MKPVWTGLLIGKMHIHGISQMDLAKEMECSREYVNGVLNAKYKPAGAKEKFNRAFCSIIERRKEE